MTPERWQQIKDLLQAALERPSAERATWLAAQCGADVELRQEVESLLATSDTADDFLRRPLINYSTTPSLPVSGELLVGQSVGPYKIEQRIGAGGMGIVYRAHDARLDRPVALKLLPPLFMNDAERVRRFRQEARAISALNHPNILTIHEIGEASASTGQTHFIATEFVAGHTLRTALKEGHLTLGIVLDVLIQTATALTAAHQAGIVHRDIKPENIMVRPDGVVKVLDFGLAKLTSNKPTARPSAFSTAHTNPGLIMGTVSYMSPEQARGLEVDERSDIFSLGVVMYELLTGQPAFVGETTGDLLVALLEHEPVPLAQRAPTLPTALPNIVQRCLAKDCAARYQKCADLLADLKALKQELELAAHLKRPGDTPVNAASLSLPVGQLSHPQTVARPSTEEQPTAATIPPSPRPTKQTLRWFRQQLRSKNALAGALGLAILLAGGALAWRRWNAEKSAATENTQAITSIAVLPFVNVLNDPQMDYLTDGVTEGIIDNLSQVAPLQVLARSTVYSYRARNKDRELDPREAGRVLNVRAVLLGRVQRQGERLLIRVELVDAADGKLLWSEQYPRPMTDLVAVQGQISREISDKLRLRLSGVQEQQIAKRHTSNSEAYQLYLLGRHYQLQATRASLGKALEAFQQAIALDPSYALAYTGVAEYYAAASAQYLPPSQAIPKARIAAETALRLDDTLPEGHFVMARVHFYDWKWVEAEREIKRTLALYPNHELAHSFYVNILLPQKRFDEALREARLAKKLNPLAEQASISLGAVFLFMRQYDEALQHFRDALELSQNNGVRRALLGRALVPQGKYVEAIAEFRQAFETDPQPTYRAWLAYGYARAGQREEALKLLRELEAQARRERVSPIYFARIYAGLGEKEKALDWLQKTFDEHSDHILIVGQEPVYDPLRAEPRFQAILRGIGLSP